MTDSKRGLIAKTDGTIEPFDMSTGLSGLQAAVGGYIEGVDFGNPLMYAYANEDGIAEELEVNPIASALFQQAWGPRAGQFILGDVVFYGGADDEGNSIGLLPEVYSILEQLAEKFKGW